MIKAAYQVLLHHGTNMKPPMKTWQSRIIMSAIAGGLTMLIALLATTPSYYHYISQAGYAGLAAGLESSSGGESSGAETTSRLPEGITSGTKLFNLEAPSLSMQVGGLIALMMPGPAPTLAMTGFSGATDAVLVIDQTRFQASVRASFGTTLITSAILVLAAILLLRLFLRRQYEAPLTALIETITEFSDDPSVASPIPDAVTQSRDFIAAAQALDALQRNTLLALRQRERLADIGEAVAKINHDIRNVLSSATLVADTLLASEDPRVRRMAPHIVRSLEQSVELCQSMLDYLAETPVPAPVRFDMNELAGEIEEAAGIEIAYSGPAELRLDRTMLSRSLLNLARNAASAGARKLDIDIWRVGRLGVIDVSDDGPGIPRDQWEELFLAFRSKRRGGSGLGLAIARDLAVAQGGNLKLTRSTEEGSEFRLQLPMQMFELTESDLLANNRR